MDGLRLRLEKEGVSEEASNLIISSRRKSTNANYESAWRKWTCWCSERKIDPFCASVNMILDFLADLFKKARAAIQNY